MREAIADILHHAQKAEEVYGGDSVFELNVGDVVELIKEVQLLRTERVAIQNDSRVVTCVFCGQAYPPGTPASNHQSPTVS